MYFSLRSLIDVTTRMHSNGRFFRAMFMLKFDLVMIFRKETFGFNVLKENVKINSKHFYC